MQNCAQVGKVGTCAAQTKEGYYFHPPLKLRNELYNDLKFANAIGKALFVKEHAPWLIDPTRQSKWIHGPHCNDEIHSTPMSWQIEQLRTTGPADLPMETEPNPTILPNEFLRQVSPTFLIRNPILSFPSHHRAMRDSWMMYDWYGKQPDHKHDMDRRPIVLDADDIMSAPEVVIQYCNFVGLDPSKLNFNWKPMESDELENIDPEFLRMKDTLHTSDGVRQDKVAAGLVLEKKLSNGDRNSATWKRRSL
ncbi:hypothetical protein N7530_009857 [Penicillium desertorum]|uniref:Sulfotransferase domain-containing protein n=1 Tax=Penicillium desertorum TaxID=1303715 RepID=A0A9W9WJF3_9EURO|nr:hypothetical protein N7530_009857 [Penicillium desertorum]